MLLWTMLVVGVVLALSIVGLLLSSRTRDLSWPNRLLLVLTGPADAAISVVVLDWLGLASLTVLVGGLLLGIMSMLFVQPLLLPQRLLVWRLARENMVRRKRQSALMIAGLVISSAIITSSLVVGDSLDATVSLEVSAAWGETDILIAGQDRMVGGPVEFNEAIGERFWDALMAEPNLGDEIIGRQYGVATVVSLTAENGKAEPSISLFAHNASVDAEGVWAPLDPASGFRFSDIGTGELQASVPGVVLNRVAADMLEVTAGETLELGAFTTSDEGRERVNSSVYVQEIVPNTGQGAMAGTSSPAVFASLASVQQLLAMEGRLNRIALAFSAEVGEQRLMEAVTEVGTVLNETLLSEDVGFEWTVDESTSSVTVSSSYGLQRIGGDDVMALRENRTTLYPDATLLEVLQVPLIDVAHEGEALLTLADSQVSQLRLSSDALWHVTSNGLGFEPTDGDEAWLWQVEEGDLLTDVAWDASSQTAGFLSGNAVVVADTGLVDETERAKATMTETPVAIAKSVEGWYVLSDESSGLNLTAFDANLSLLFSQSVGISPEGTVLSYGIRTTPTHLHLRLEGLLSTTYYVSPLESIAFSASDEGAWPSDETTASSPLPEPCDGQAAVETPTGEVWCTYDQGLVRLNATSLLPETIRLPVLSDAQGFGKLPQMVLAFGGEGAPLSVNDGEVLTSARLSLLNLNNTSVFSLTGILPYAYGNDSAVLLAPAGTYSAVPGFDQLTELDSVVLGLVSLSDAETLALAEEDDRSLLMFTGDGFGANNTSSMVLLESWFDERSSRDDINLRVRAVQLEAAEQAEASSGALSAMFLVFGTFTIAAGVLLSLTIIMLLADVRRTELATVRALGLRRSDTRALFVYEGAILAFVSSGLGTLLGLALAWVISVGFSVIFATVDAQTFSFSWTLDSLLSGWIWGTLIALVLLWSSALYNAQLNIVQALRGARATVRKDVPWGVFLLQILAFGLTGLCLLSLLLSGYEGTMSYAAYVLMGVGGILLFAPFLTWELPVLLNRNKPMNRFTRHAARNTLGCIGVLFLLWTLVLAPFDPLRQRMEPNELAFIVLGLLQVFAGVLVLTSLAPLVVGWLAKRRWVTKRTGPVGSVALSHPLAHPVRTAVVMGMFSITMFSVVVLSGYTEQFDTYSSTFVEEAEGDFELLLTSTRSRPIDLGASPEDWGIDHPAIDNIDAVGGVYRAPVHMENDAGERMRYPLRGVDEGFVHHGGLPLHVWDLALGNTSDEAWRSLGTFDSVVFLDASFGLENTADGTTLVPLQFSIGDSILLIDMLNPKNTRSVQVGGFLEQSSYIFSPGVWMKGETVSSQFSGEITRMYVSVDPNAEATDAYEGESKPEQGKSASVRKAAAELEEVLDAELASSNVNVLSVADEVMIIQSLVLAILSLFEGYLALGLMVGVAGIGVVTVRNVSERRRTIGMLRAIGFRKKLVSRLFLLEISWVAVLGMLNGLFIGFGFHFVLYKAIWEGEGAPFEFPWGSTAGLFLFAWLVVLLTTFLPVRKASNIPPSAALRNL